MKKNKQTIDCTVHDCKYCNCECDLCELDSINVCNCGCDGKKENTMCGSYKKKSN